MEKQTYSGVASSQKLSFESKAWFISTWLRMASKAGVALTALAGLADVGAALALGQDRVVLAQNYDVVPPLPAGVMPVPAETFPQAPVGGEQYVVFVRGDSPRLLEQVRIVEPTAFRTTLQGQSVIQVGRFNQAANADQRVRDLQAQGFGAEMAQVEASVPYYAQTPALPANVYAANGDLPPLPVDVLPSAQGGDSLPPMANTVPPTEMLPSVSSVEPPMAALPPSPALPPVSAPVQVAQGPANVEFGQELNYSAPPFPGDSPVNVTPSGTAAPFTPAQTSVNAPYYVVIPTSQENLPALSNQVIQLGTPADRVQQRTSPRGPHVAIGPFEDRGLANRWNNFYREAGIPNSRVFYDP